MLKQRASTLKKIAITLDNVTLVSAFLCAYSLHQAAGTVGELNEYVWVLFFACPCWFILLTHFKLYESLRLRSNASIIWALFKVHVIGGMLLAAIIFAISPHSYSRLLFISFLLLSFLLMCLAKILITVILHRFRLKGFNVRNILIIGTGQNALKMCELIYGHREWGLNLVGLISVADGDVVTTDNSVQVIGLINNLIDICKQRTVDEVVFALEKNDSRELIKYFQDLEDLGLTFRVMIDFLPLRRSRTQINLFNDEVPMLTFSSVSLISDQLFAKRCLDVIGSLVGLFITALMLPFLALAIKLDSRGAVFLVRPVCVRTGVDSSAGNSVPCV